MNGREAFPRLRVVLVDPRYNGNLGQVARAMRNFGLTRLVLVGGDADPGSEEARWFARDGGEPILDRCVRVATLLEAIADCSVAIGTTRRHGKYRGEPKSPREIYSELTPWATATELALVFGREAHGLSTAELDLCQRLITIPSDDACPSLNLAHSVAVLGYELFQMAAAAGALGPPETAEEKQLASAEQVEGMFEHMRRVFVRIGYSNIQNPESILRRWRQILGRGQLTVHDINVVRALAHQTDWVARMAGIPEGGPKEAPELFNKHQNPGLLPPNPPR